MLQPAQQKLLNADFTAAVSNHYGAQLAKIMRYGSDARGDGHEEPDVNYLVVLKDISPVSKVFRMSKIVRPIALRQNIDISFRPYPLIKFTNETSAFLHRVRKEGKEIA